MAKKPKINQKITDHNFDSRDGMGIRYIVIHYTGDREQRRMNLIIFIPMEANRHRLQLISLWTASRSGQSVLKRNKAWHCGGGLQDGARSAAYHNVCLNANSIGVEMCCYKKDGKIVMPYEEYVNVKALVKWLMALYGIPKERIIRHHDVTGKECPNVHTINAKGKISKTTLLNDKHWKKWRKNLVK